MKLKDYREVKNSVEYLLIGIVNCYEFVCPPSVSINSGYLLTVGQARQLKKIVHEIKNVCDSFEKECDLYEKKENDSER